MSAEWKLVLFRFKQFGRAFSSLGTLFLLVLIPMLLFLGAYLAQKLLLIPEAYIFPLYVVLPQVVHLRRKDRILLSKLELSFLKLFTLEYTVLCLPISLALLGIHQAGLFVLLGHILVLVQVFFLSKTQVKIKSFSLAWKTFLPLGIFEWKASVRKYHYQGIFIWLLGLAAAFNPFAYYFFAFLFAGFIADTFNPLEGKELAPQNLTELHQKLRKNLLFIFLALLPQFILYAALHPDYSLGVLFLLTFFVVYQTYCFLYKYQYEREGGQVSNQIPTAIFIFLSPFFPISIPYVLYMYFKTRRRFVYA